MNKLQKRPDTESHDDDVAGLFQRLGDRDDTRAYQDFSSQRVRAKPVVTPLEPVPADPVVAAPAPAASVPTVAPAVAAPAAAALKTPLEALFLRLAAARTATPGHSPLSRLRER